MTTEILTTTALLPHLVEQWAAATPTARAITYDNHHWTWSQWNERIRRAAGGLLAAGIRHGDRIAFLDKNHPAGLEVTFAAASLGAATGVLNWRSAGAELEFVLNDCGARILFVGAEFAGTIDEIRTGIPNVERIVVIGGESDEYEAFLAAADPTPPSGDLEQDDVCLLIYSSGTTGRPKGVMLSHKALIAHTRNAGPAFPFDTGDVNLVAMPLCHVGGTSWALIGIYAGVPSVITRNPDLPSLIDAMQAGATHAFLVPPVVSGILDAGQPALSRFSRLRYLGYGAAPMPLPLLRKALNAWPELNFVQIYGQTELAGGVTVLDPADHRDPTRPERLLSVGKPGAGTEFRVAEIGTRNSVAPGAQGELMIRTDQRMAGYLNRPDATGETITSDGWLHTGDIGRIDADGYIYIEDRLKDMIITGGENVYGPEVERVLLTHPAIADAAVIGVPDERWGESVKAIVTATDSVTAEEIIAFCRENLAGYKCPRTIDFVAALPHNATGKILKRELRSPYWAEHDRGI